MNIDSCFTQNNISSKRINNFENGVCHSTAIGTGKPRVDSRVDEILPPSDLSKQLSSKTSPQKENLHLLMNVRQNIQEHFLKKRNTCLHRSPISFPPPGHLRFPWCCKLSHVPLKKRLTHHYKCKAFFLTFKPTFFQHPIIMLVIALLLN